MFGFAWILNNIVHFIFAMKYWVLSRKIKQTLDNIDTNYFEIKVKVIFYLQIILIIVAGALFIWSTITFINNFPSLAFYILLVTLIVSPSFIIVIILANGLYVMKQATEITKY